MPLFLRAGPSSVLLGSVGGSFLRLPAGGSAKVVGLTLPPSLPPSLSSFSVSLSSFSLSLPRSLPCPGSYQLRKMFFAANVVRQTAEAAERFNQLDPDAAFDIEAGPDAFSAHWPAATLLAAGIDTAAGIESSRVSFP